MNPSELDDGNLIALVDCDGVLADFAGHILDLVGSDKTLDDVKRWDVFQLMTPTQRKAAKLILECGRFWRTQPIIPGALAGVRLLRDRGYRIVCVTSPWISCPVWGSARREWLEEHFDVAGRDIIITSQKELVVGGDLFFDDSPAHAMNWQIGHRRQQARTPDLDRAPGRAVLVDAPYNQDGCLDHPSLSWPDDQRMRGWSDLARVLS